MSSQSQTVSRHSLFVSFFLEQVLCVHFKCACYTRGTLSLQCVKQPLWVDSRVASFPASLSAYVNETSYKSCISHTLTPKEVLIFCLFFFDE